MYEQRSEDTSRVAMLLLRFAVLGTFLLIMGRLYQLQIVQGDDLQAAADDNRLREIEIPAPRGVIYDRNGQIVARNRPSFEIGIVPADLPLDDIETPDFDEEAAAIEQIVLALRADAEADIAVRIAEIAFRKLGHVDYATTLNSVGVAFNYVSAIGGTRTMFSREDGLTHEEPVYIDIPDTSQPLPPRGLVALVQRLVQIGRQGSTSESVLILDLVDRIRALNIGEDDWALPGLIVKEVPVREYVYEDLLSHVLGFMGPIPAGSLDNYLGLGYKNPNEKVGLSGLEYSYQEELRGKPGLENIEVDILGRKVRTEGEILEPVLGSNLVLNIDLGLQRIMHQSLQEMMDEKEARWGVTIAMNPMNGAVLGLVSLPSFDNNIFAERIGEDYFDLADDDRRPLINYAIGGHYPPGSVFKLVTATGALQEGVITARETLADNGPLYLPNKFLPDDRSQDQEFVSWNHRLGINHGPITMAQAIALSNDIYFYLIGGGYPPNNFRGLNDSGLAKWSELFGYGYPTGIDLPGEISPLVPDNQWKRQTWAESWTTGDSYNMAIGQGYVLATPLQVLVSTATVANDGLVLEPQIVYQVVDANGHVQRDFTPKVKGQLPVDPGVLATVRQGMWTAVHSDYGTAISARLENGIESGGKTGTAEFCEYIEEENDCRRDTEDNLPTHAWYVAYAPYENPEIAVVTFVYDGGEGSEAAIPVTKTILDAYFSQINPQGESSQ